MANIETSGENAKPPGKKALLDWLYSIWKERKFLIIGLLTGMFVLVGPWVQQANINVLQKQINSLQESQDFEKLTPQERLELQKDIVGLEKDRITLANNVYGTLVQAAGGAALLIGLYFTWRNQKIAEETAANNFKSAQEAFDLSELTAANNFQNAQETLRLSQQTAENNFKSTQETLRLSQQTAENNFKSTQETLRLSQEGQITERYSRSIEQLGDKERIEVRLGGIYALERIAKDSPKDHWTIMEVLTSFIQEKSPVQENKNNQEEESKTEEKKFPKITKDVQAALTVIRRRDASKDPEDKSLDLSKAVLIEADLSGTYLIGADFSKADLIRANFSGTYLSGANLYIANLTGANLSKVKLIGAKLIGAKLPTANVAGANLSEAVLLTANLSGAILSGADLSGAVLHRADLSGANLSGANLSGADLRVAILYRADLSGADLRGADLRGAKELTLEQVKSAKYWEEAKYNPEFREVLGLPPESTIEEEEN